MPVIQNFDPTRLNSPLRELLVRFAAAPFLIAPERREELERIQEEQQIRILIDAADDAFVFRVNPETKVIRAGLAALERLWCYCYSFRLLFNLLNNRPRGQIIQLESEPSVAPAWNLLKWAYRDELSQTRSTWPKDLPRPDVNAESFDVGQANTYFLTVSSFILLHEIGHILRRHTADIGKLPNESIREELEADHWAAEHILGRWQQYSSDEEVFIQRANGIATGLVLLAGVELEFEPNHIRTHPKVPERLLTFFDEFVPEGSSPVASRREYPMYFAATVLYAYMLNKGVEFDYLQTFDTLSDFFIAVSRVF